MSPPTGSSTSRERFIERVCRQTGHNIDWEEAPAVNNLGQLNKGYCLVRLLDLSVPERTAVVVSKLEGSGR